MGLHLPHLDDKTRSLMLLEFDDDQEHGRLYLGPRLNARGIKDYPGLLPEALEGHDDDWLADRLSAGLLNLHESRRKPKGGSTTANVPANAHETLAEGEFNRFYCRAICLRAESEAGDRVSVYRAKQVSAPRPESERLIGKQLTASTVLADLRSNVGLDTILGIPPGPNSGLSVSFIAD